MTNINVVQLKWKGQARDCLSVSYVSTHLNTWVTLRGIMTDCIQITEINHLNVQSVIIKLTKKKNSQDIQKIVQNRPVKNVEQHSKQFPN